MTLQLRVLLFYTIVSFSTILSTTGQRLKDIVVDDQDNGKKLVDFIKELENQHQVDFIYPVDRINSMIITGVKREYNITDFLEVFLAHLSYAKINDRIMVIAEQDRIDLIKAGKYFLVPFANVETELNGVVFDASTDEPMINAQVFIPANNSGTITDFDGKFSLTIPHNLTKLIFTYTGFDPLESLIIYSEKADESAFFSINLYPSSTELAGVVISAEKSDVNISSQLMGVEKMGIKTIKSLPPFMGEVDPVKGLITLPGVSTTGEISSGFNVRGGESGQNLILQDGAVIFNPTHLFGFFSAFNPDVVNDVTLYKGAGPATFGGRVSSVLDISMRNGDVEEYKVQGALGLISSRLTVEGPIIPQQSSFIIGGRLSYSNWLINAVDDIRLKNSSANFYDITGKIYQRLSERDYITLSAYHSYDDFSFGGDSVFSWTTTNISLKYEHNLTDQLTNTLQINNSNYSSSIVNQRIFDAFKYSNGINNLSFKNTLSWQKEDEQVYVLGLEAVYGMIDPGKKMGDDEARNIASVKLNDQKSLQASLYFNGNMKVSDQLSVTAGLRYSHFFRFGSDQVFSINRSEIDDRYYRITDTTNFQPGAIVSQFNGFEPRLSLRYLVSPSSSLKASYYRVYQFMHLISNTISPTPFDFWINSSPNIRPQVGDQFSLGYFHNFDHDNFEFSIEGFYKKVANTLDYLEGVNIALNSRLEAGMAQGDGKAYGLEFLLRKNRGIINGWLSYTFSRSLRQFDTDIEALEINGGEWYPSFFDQPHNLSLVLNYNIKPNIILTSNFSYSSGRPITIPVSKFTYGSVLSVLNYSQRNAYRIPAFHRWDLSLTLKGRNYNHGKFSDEWIFSIYNVYGRRNPYSIFFNEYGNAYNLSILGTIFPSLTYNFKFK